MPGPEDHLDENAALALVDGTLPAKARAEVERHVGSCDACRELLAELARGFDSVRAERSPDTHRIAAGTTLHGGRYRIEHEIGSGSAGTVYRARDERTREIVALKVVTDPQLASRFAREAHALARLDHPAIVRYVAHGETPGGGGMYLAMEWLDGEDLEQRIQRGAPGWEAARVLGIRLAGALGNAHRLGLVHRDMSPRNVFLPHGRLDAAKLLDFGLVRLPDGQMLERTASQAILGTPYYMAPEQVRDPRRVDGRADLFGLGVLLYETTTGKRPYEGTDLFSLWANIVGGVHVPITSLAPDTPAAFVQLVEALLAKDPAARPATGELVERALVELDAARVATEPLARPIDPLRFTAIIDSPRVQSSTPPWTAPPVHVRSPYHPPPQAVTVPPPQAPPPAPRMPSAGLFMAAGAGIMAVIAGLVFIAFALTHPSSRTKEDDETVISTPAAPPETPAATPVKDDEELAPPASARPATVVTPPPAKAAPEVEPVKVGHSLMCSYGTTSETGGQYASATEQQNAVFVANECTAVLEDCKIRGARSVLVAAHGKLTLRHCNATGTVEVLGPTATLILEGSTVGEVKATAGGKVVFR